MIQRIDSPRTGDAFLPAGHAMVLGMTAAGAPLTSILDAIAELIEAEVPDSCCSVMLLDDRGVLQLGSGPSLPMSLVAALGDGLPVGPASGTCGTAVHRRRPVFHDDVLAASEWAGFRDVAEQTGVRACWSVPIHADAGRILGAVALYLPAVGSPSGADVQRLAGYASLAAVAIRQDVTARALEHRAHRDDLTGLASAAALPGALSAAAAAPGTASLTLVDVGRLGECNRALGFDAGNELLRAAALRLRSQLPPDQVLVRTGGGTFAVVLRTDDPEAALAIARGLVRAVAAPYVIAGVGFTADPRSATVSCRPQDPPQVTISRCAARLAATRRNGRLPAIADRSAGVEQLVMEHELRTALSEPLAHDPQVAVHYQPVIHLDLDDPDAPPRIVAAEALARWEHPTRGRLQPSTFLPLVAQGGLHRQLTARVLGQALADVARWRAHTGRPMSVAVNLTAHELHDGRLIDLVDRELTRNALPGDALTIELTEQAAVTDVQATSGTLANLSHMGVRVGMDDFGTGYSSLTHVRDLTLDHLKIDRSFVADMDVSASDAAVVAAILGLAEGLGIGVVAEGVESAGQRDMLRDLGCPMAQGFLWSPAVPAGDLEGMLRAIAPS